MRQVFGEDPTGYGLTRPPLVAFPLKAVTFAFGDVQGPKILAGLISIAPGIPLFFLMRRFAPPAVTILAATGFIFSTQFSAMYVWGFLTFFGIFLLLSAWVLLIRGLEGSRASSIAAGICAGLAVGFHQVSAVIVVAFLVTWAIFSLASTHSKLRSKIEGFGLAAIAGTVTSLPFLPAYLSQLSNSGSNLTSLAGQPQAQRVGWAGVEGFFDRFLVGPDFSGVIVGLSLLGLVYLVRRDPNVALGAIALAIVWLVVKFEFTEGAFGATLSSRSNFFLYAPLWLGLGALPGLVASSIRLRFVRVPTAWRISMMASSVMLGGLVLWQIADFGTGLERRLKWYHYLGESQHAAVEWIRTNTPEGSQISVYPRPLGWWMEGSVGRNALEDRDRTTGTNIFQVNEALVTDLLLSRNSGVHNGQWLFARIYPEASPAGGTPLVKAYLGGSYKDLYSFNDSGTKIDGATILNAFRYTEVVESSNGLELATVYESDSWEVRQRSFVSAAGGDAIVSFEIVAGAAPMPVSINLLMLSPKVHFEALGSAGFSSVIEARTSSRGRLTATIERSIILDGARFDGFRDNREQVASGEHGADSLWADFTVEQPRSTLTFTLRQDSFEVPATMPDSFDSSTIVAEQCVGYLVVDTASSSPSIDRIPWRTTAWLDSSPLWTPAASFDRVRIYASSLELPCTRIAPQGVS